MLAIKALYGLKSSGAAFRAFLAETLDAIGYQPRYDNPDLRLRPAVKLDGFEYNEYILCYVDNVLYISHNLRKLMKSIQENFKLKNDKIEPPDVYLGSTLAKMNLESGKYCWTMLPEQYLKVPVTNVEEDLTRSSKNMFCHAFMGRPAARPETMALVIHSYVLVKKVHKR